MNLHNKIAIAKVYPLLVSDDLESTSTARSAQLITQLSIAVTGIAGPTGGTIDKPVGTVCFAWAMREGGCEAQTGHFPGDRAAVRA